MGSLDLPSCHSTSVANKEASAASLQSTFYNALQSCSGRHGAIPAVFPTRDENLHRALKKPIAPLYSLSHAASLETRVDDVLSVLVAQLDKRFVQTSSELDLDFWSRAFAFDTMGVLTFSKRYGFLETGSDVQGMAASIWKFMIKAAPVNLLVPPP